MANLLIELSSLRRKVGYAGNFQTTPINCPRNDASCYWSITANWVTTNFMQFSALFWILPP